MEVESLFEGEDFSETLTRAMFEELNMDRSLQGNSQTSAEGESLETLYFSKVHLNKSYQWPVSGA